MINVLYTNVILLVYLNYKIRSYHYVYNTSYVRLMKEQQCDEGYKMKSLSLLKHFMVTMYMIQVIILFTTEMK